MNGHPPDPRGETQTEQEFLLQAPLLKNIEAQMKVCRNQKEWAILQVKRALYLTRTDRLGEALDAPNEIRRIYKGQEDPEIYVWLWLLEAVIAFYSSGTTAALLSIKRAAPFASILQRNDLAQYLAAWAAHFSFTDDDAVALCQWLRKSNLDCAALPEAACRASLTFAVAWQTAGERKAADIWFDRARNIARKIGDRATIMASIANRASTQLNDIWIRYHFGKQSDFDLKNVEIELRGALAYERVTGSTSIPLQAPLMRARICFINGNYVEALRELESGCDVDGRFKYSVFQSANLFRQLLNALTGNSVDYFFETESGIEAKLACLDLDDQAVSWKILGRLADMAGVHCLVPVFFRRAEECFERYIEYCRKLSILLCDVEAAD